MIDLHSFSLKDVVLFGEETVKITDNDGLVVVTGLNKDSSVEGDTNASGKSLLFSAIPCSRYESDPLVVTKGKGKAKKDLLSDKSSGITLKFKDNQNKPITYFQGAGKYTLHYGKKDQKVQTQAIAKDKMDNIWPQTEAEFYATSYIQSQRACSFQKASHADRLKFMTEVFRLDIYDQMRAKFKKLLTEIKDKEIEHRTLAGQFDIAQRQIDKLAWTSSSQKELEEAEMLLASKQKSYTKLNAKKSNLEQLLASIKDIEKLQKDIKQLNSELPFKKTRKDAKAFIKEQLELHSEHSTYKKLMKSYEKSSVSLESRMKDLEESLGDDICKSIKDISKELEYCYTSIEGFKDIVSKGNKLNASLDELKDEAMCIKAKLFELGFKKPPKVNKPRDLDEEIATDMTIIRLAQSLEEHEHGDDCPTCGSEINLKSIKKSAKAALLRVTETKALRKAINLASNLKEIKSSISEIGSYVDVSVAQEKIKKFTKTQNRLESVGYALRDLKSLRKSLSELDKPKKPKSKPDSKYTVEILEDAIETLNDLGSKQKTLSSLTSSMAEDTDSKKLKSSINELDKKIDLLLSSVETIMEEVNRMKTSSAEYGVLSRQKKNLSKQLKSLKPFIKRKAIVEMLFKQYGSTNLKLKAASQILGILENSLNKYSSLVFAENMKFKLEPTKQGISATVSRKSGKTSDISKMSGAESNCFRLLFAISLLPLIPDDRRTNFIILDEPDAACGSAVRNRMITEFLPKLRAIVPHVFWVTPKNVDLFQQHQLWKVVKEKGVSKIHKEY